MVTHLAGRDVVRGERLSWGEAVPGDLRLRLADVLEYDNCSPDDLWEAIRDWLESRGVGGPHVRHLSVVPGEASPQTSPTVVASTQAESAMQLSRLVYTSQHENLDAAVFDSIVVTSERNNVRDQVTGVLVVDEGNFLQMLEGSREAIAKCFARIIEDPRHHNVQLISCGDVSRRLFQDWSMRLVNVHKIKKEMLAAHCVEGKFQPHIMSEFAIEDFCRALTHDDFEIVVA